MKLAQLSALSAAMILASAAQANEFMSDASFDIHLRNYFMDKTQEVGSTKDSNDQWSQAISANFSSGYFENIIGVDLGMHYALKLKADDLSAAGGVDADLLQTGADEVKPESYGKTSYAVKVNLADMGTARYGRLFLETPLLKNNYSRSLPGLTEAFHAEASFEGIDLYGVWATKSNHRTESGFSDFEVNGEKEEVKILGGGYDMGNGLTADLAVGQQDEFARKYFVDLGYAMDMQGASVDAGLVYGHNSLLGYTKDNRGAGVDDSQSVWGATVKAGVQQASFGLSYQKVSQSGITDSAGKNRFDKGWGGTQNDVNGFIGPHALMISDHRGDGQTSWGVHAGYDFAGMIDGLSLKLVYVDGETDPQAGGKADETEYNVTAAYAVPQVENLSVAARYAQNKTKVQSSGVETENSQVRLIVKYDMSVF